MALIRLTKAQILKTSRGTAMPGRFLIPLPGDEAERHAAAGWCEVVDSLPVIVRKDIVSKALGHRPPGAQPIELPTEEAQAFAKQKLVAIVTDEALAAEVYAKGWTSTQSDADVAATKAKETEERRVRNRARYLLDAHDWLTLGTVAERPAQLIEGWDTPKGSLLGLRLAERHGIARPLAEELVGEATKLTKPKLEAARVAAA